MKTKILLLLALCTCLTSFSQEKKVRRIKNKKIENIYIVHNPNQIRIPLSKVEIGIGVIVDNEKYLCTKGYLNGSLKWRNFVVKVDNGSFWNGNVKLSHKEGYLKDSCFTVSVYRRKGRKLLKTQKIPYNYEMSVQVVTEHFTKAPGSRIKFGFKTQYNNEHFVEYWPKNAYNTIDDYKILTNGVSLGRKGLYIHENPFSIKNHTVSTKVILKKNPEISDEFCTVLDYRKNYSFTDYGRSGSNGSNGIDGHTGSIGGNGGCGTHGSPGSDGKNADDLEVYVSAYFDTIIHQELLYLSILNLKNSQLKEYLINTQGGSITINSLGGSGGCGGDGGDGGDGGNGRNGRDETIRIYVNDSTTTTKHIQTPGGDGGNGGNGGDGAYGGYGGDGGNITLLYTKYAQAHLKLIHLSSVGGSGGSGGIRGSGGSGGNGGSGSPSGNRGSNGHSGHSGNSGGSGYSGYIHRILVDD